MRGGVNTKNQYEVRGDVTAIFLKSNKYGDMEALISTNKLERLKEFPNTWYAAPCKSSSMYVMGKIKGKCYMLHRWILDPPKEMVIDHINHDTLNNTDSNLREITHAHNNQNRVVPQRYSKSGILGVSWHKATGKWRANIKIDGKQISLGYFRTTQEAEKAVKEARAKYMPYSQEASA